MPIPYEVERTRKTQWMTHPALKSEVDEIKNENMCRSGLVMNAMTLAFLSLPKKDRNRWMRLAFQVSEGQTSYEDAIKEAKRGK